MGAISQASEDCLKTIYRLQKGEEKVGRVTTSLVAERMQASAASVSGMIEKLAALKLLNHTPYRGIELTRAGEKIALEILRYME